MVSSLKRLATALSAMEPFLGANRQREVDRFFRNRADMVGTPVLRTFRGPGQRFHVMLVAPSLMAGSTMAAPLKARLLDWVRHAPCLCWDATCVVPGGPRIGASKRK